jgi:hypothetical protein
VDCQRLRAPTAGERELDVVVAGPEDGVPVVFQLGTAFAGDPLAQ